MLWILRIQGQSLHELLFRGTRTNRSHGYQFNYPTSRHRPKSNNWKCKPETFLHHSQYNQTQPSMHKSKKQSIDKFTTQSKSQNNNKKINQHSQDPPPPTPRSTPFLNPRNPKNTKVRMYLRTYPPCIPYIRPSQHLLHSYRHYIH